MSEDKQIVTAAITAALGVSTLAELKHKQLQDDDALKGIFEAQTSLVNLFIDKRKLPNLFLVFHKAPSYFPNRLTDQVKSLVTSMQMELAEFVNWFPWKYWKSNQQPINMDEAKLELIDILHFLVEAMLLLGMTAEETATLFHAKQAENHDRQKRGY